MAVGCSPEGGFGLVVEASKRVSGSPRFPDGSAIKKGRVSLLGSFENFESLTDRRRRRHAFCALRGKNRAGASVVCSLTQGSAPYRSLHPGLVYVATFGAWRMFGSWDTGLIRNRRRVPARFASLRLSVLMNPLRRASACFASWLLGVYETSIPLPFGVMFISCCVHFMDMGYSQKKIPIHCCSFSPKSNAPCPLGVLCVSAVISIPQSHRGYRVFKEGID